METAHLILAIIAYGLAFLAGAVVFFGYVNQKYGE